MKIIPRSVNGSIAEVVVAHPKRRPVAPGSDIESNRVDIGVFVHNGHSWSAPAFITWFGLDDETRSYDAKNRVGEISYIGGEVRIAVNDWRKILSKDYADFLPPLTLAQTEALAKIEKERAEFDERVKAPEGDRAVDTYLFKKYDAAKNEFVEKEKKKFLEVFGPTHLTALAKLAQSDLAANPEFKKRESKATAFQRNQIATIERRIKEYDPPLDPAVKDQPIVKSPTAFDLEFRELLNAERLNQIVFGGALQVQRHINYVDPRLSIGKKWRDTYLYEPGGQCVGWVRTQPDRRESYFTADGLLVVTRDDLGRCKTAKAVTYSAAADPSSPDRMRLTWTPDNTVSEYVYDGPEDRRGKLKK